MNSVVRIVLKVVNTILPVIAALLLGSVIIIWAGASPVKVYTSIVRSAFFSLNGLNATFVYATPLILTGLSLVIAFRAGVFNMGGEGQLYMGAFWAAVVGFSVKGLPAPFHITLCLLTGIICGALWALIPALLKAYLRINELVTTIMLNTVAITLTGFLTNGPYAYSYQYPTTAPIYKSAELPALFEGRTLTIGIIIALVVFVLVNILISKTTLGYEIDMMGHQAEFGEAVGMNIRKKTVIVFLVSGAICGLAGAIVVMSVYHSFTPSFSANPGLGWDGMTVAMLGNTTPVGSLIAAILFGAFKFGGVSLQIKFGIPNEVIQTIQSSLMLFLSVRFINENAALFKRMFKKEKKEIKADKEGEE